MTLYSITAEELQKNLEMYIQQAIDGDIIRISTEYGNAVLISEANYLELIPSTEESIEITIVADKNLIECANALFVELGLDMDTAINLFLRKCIEENGIPFPVTKRSKDCGQPANHAYIVGPRKTGKEVLPMTKEQYTALIDSVKNYRPKTKRSENED